jgi:hypothetical protein
MTIEDLEKAVARLPPDDLARFSAWFEQFNAARFDDKIERDANAGKLDRLADAALDRGEARKARPDISIMFDLCASGEPTDIARDKDKMIGDAVWQEYLRKTGRKPRQRRQSKVLRR